MWPFGNKKKPAPPAAGGQKAARVHPPLELPFGASPGMPVWSNWSADKAIREGLNASPWVAGSILRITNAAASVDWRAEARDDGDDNWTAQTRKHPLARLWQAPNPHIGQGALMVRLVQHLLLTGNALLIKGRDATGQVVRLYPVNPDSIKPVPSADPVRWLERYDLMGDAARTSAVKSYAPEDVIHLRIENPEDPFWGRPPLQDAAVPVDVDRRMSAWNLHAMDQRMAPDGVLSLKGVVSQARYDAVISKLRSQRQGPKGARAVLVLDDEVGYTSLQQGSPLEFDFIASRRQNLLEIACVFGVPLPLLGDLGDATYSNFWTAVEAFWRLTVIPLLNLVMEGVNRSLEPDFGENVRLAWDMASAQASAETLQRRVSAGQALHGMGTPLAEINRVLDLGLQPVPGWETGYVAGGMTPTGLAGMDPMDDPFAEE